MSLQIHKSWIPVDERLPEDGVNVLGLFGYTSTKSGNTLYRIKLVSYDQVCNLWDLEDCPGKTVIITHWQHLPPIYEGEER